MDRGADGQCLMSKKFAELVEEKSGGKYVIDIFAANALGSQEEVLDAKTRQKQILKAVDELPRKMRQVVVWYEFEEMSYDQIAAKTGEPVGTIKSRLFNARKTLSEKLQHLKGDR